MFVREFGPEDAPVILALHPMGITGENLYQALAPYLTGRFRVIAPDQGGHGMSGHYVSFQDEVDTLKAGLKERGLDHFCLLFGASMGVDAAYELLKDPGLHFEKVWLDGAGFLPDGPEYKGAAAVLTKAVVALIKKFPGLLKRNFSKTYGPEFGRIMGENFMHFNGEDVIHIFETFSRMKLVPLPENILGNLHLEWGENDNMFERSRPALEKYFPGVNIVRRPGYGHCAYMAGHTGEYVCEMEKFINGAGEMKRQE